MVCRLASPCGRGLMVNKVVCMKPHQAAVEFHDRTRIDDVTDDDDDDDDALLLIVLSDSDFVIYYYAGYKAM